MPERVPPGETTVDLLAAWCRDRLAHAQLPDGHPLLEVAPKDLQRPPWRLTALEALEARGDLERVPGPALAWRPVPAAQKPGKGYALPLSPKEHGALLRLLDEATDRRQVEWVLDVDLAILRAIRSRLREAT